MNFEFTEDQKMLRDSVERFAQNEYGFERRRAIVAGEFGFSAENWAQFAQLGWLSIPFAEEHGGIGGNAVDLIALLEPWGAGLIAEPFLPTVVLFGGLLREAGAAEQQAQWLPRLIEGEVQGAFAHGERGSRYALHDVALRAEAVGKGGKGAAYVLNGEKTVVLNGAAADAVIVSARTSGAQADKEGISLFLVDAAQAGAQLARTPCRLMDGQVAANLRFNQVKVGPESLLGEAGAGLKAIDAVMREAVLAACAEALGIMSHLNAATLEYTKTRQQFGAPLSSFQALQHRMVDAFIACEQTRSLLYRAACNLQDEANDEREDRRNLHALKAMVGEAGGLVGYDAVQLHGGMGVSDELEISHYVKRLMMIRSLFGDADYHRQAFSALSV